MSHTVVPYKVLYTLCQTLVIYLWMQSTSGTDQFQPSDLFHHGSELNYTYIPTCTVTEWLRQGPNVISLPLLDMHTLQRETKWKLGATHASGLKTWT